MKERFNSIYMGANFGIIAPILGVCIYYLLQFTHITFDEYIDFIADKKVLPAVLSISVLLTNLLIFFICIWTKTDKAARGVIFATVFYGIIIVILKVF